MILDPQQFLFHYFAISLKKLIEDKQSALSISHESPPPQKAGPSSKSRSPVLTKGLYFLHGRPEGQGTFF